MSLVLRSKCQSVLDNVKLFNLHCRINNNKNLTICGECGQSLVTISGIKFARFDPTLKEIDYAANLLETFIDEHFDKIAKYISLRTKFKNLSEPVWEDTKNNIKYNKRYLYNKHNRGFDNAVLKLPVKNKGTIKLTFFDSSSSIEDAEIDLTGKVTFGDIKNIKVNTKLIGKILYNLKKIKEYEDLEETVEAAKRNLNTCDI